ncbi:MAG: endonuclease III domain-containing protein [Deltaproteobacteria bacterium]|nr:endonuclease III domain-containing protein [Deltaproteobacteria bacterium]
MAQRLEDMFTRLLNHFGPQHWWPGETELEVIVGAVLTQNTNWKNVEKAILNLKERGLLSPDRLNALSVSELAQLIRPAGYYNIKAKRLKNLIDLLRERYGLDLSRLLDQKTDTLRQELLSVNGIGFETADSILLYAARRPVFVVDAYTHRILRRHGMTDEQTDYHELQSLFMDHLPEEPSLFNEFHALIVRTGKEYCRRKSLCHLCPLQEWGPVPPLV